MKLLLDRPLGHLIFTLVALIGDHIYLHFYWVLGANLDYNKATTLSIRAIV